MAWIIIILMSLSVIGYVGLSFINGDAAGNQVKEYNGYKFYFDGYSWKVQVNGQAYQMRYLPEELKDYDFYSYALNFNSLSKIYLINSLEDNISAETEIQYLSQILYTKSINPQPACLDEKNCSADLPIMNCDEKDGIVLSFSETTSFSKEGKCLIMQAKDAYEMHRLSERLAYYILGIF